MSDIEDDLKQLKGWIANPSSFGFYDHQCELIERVCRLARVGDAQEREAAGIPTCASPELEAKIDNAAREGRIRFADKS